tara:strand:- start:691 stop:888 length:198 start_codon:yes stop_codon:yes gene_type:complete
MKLLYNPFKKKNTNNSIWNRLRQLSSFTWENKVKIDKLSSIINEMQLIIEKITKPKKRGRPKKNA